MIFWLFWAWALQLNGLALYSIYGRDRSGLPISIARKIKIRILIAPRSPIFFKMEEPRASPPSAKMGKSWDSPRFPLTFVSKFEEIGPRAKRWETLRKIWIFVSKVEVSTQSWNESYYHDPSGPNFCRDCIPPQDISPLPGDQD